jgi:hypothetical protein
MRPVRTFVAALSAVAITIVGVGLSSDVAHGAAAGTGNALKRWAATQGDGVGSQTATQDQAVADATNYDVIVALIKTFPPYLAAMRAANPAVKVLAYYNGTYAQQNQGTMYPDSWYAHDANGNKVTSISQGNYLMDVSNPAWVQDRAQRCADYVAQSGYDGCYVDMLGNATVGAGYDTSLPVNPATHQPWTAPDWIAATSKIGAAVKTANPNLMVVGNGLTNGNQYFTASFGPASHLLDGLDGANAQGFMRSENAPVTQFRSPKLWLQDVTMLADAGSRGRSVLAMSKVGVSATSAQMQQLHRYALASFLLGTDGTQYFYFQPGPDQAVLAPDSPDDHVQVGTPTAAMLKQGGAYVRTFSAGMAVVNPTTAAVTVKLGGTYHDLDGQTVKQVTMPAHTGMVFTK